MESINSTEFEKLIVQKLPAILREHGEFRYVILGIIADAFASKDDLKQLIEEIRNLIEVSNKQFEAINNRLDSQQTEIKNLRSDQNRRFEAIDQKFDKVDKQFEAIDLRFDKVDQRFEAIDQRFDKIDKRFEAIDLRFDQVDKRFEVVNRTLRDMRLEVSALGGRFGYGLEEVIRQTVEEFSGQEFKEVKHLILNDKEGELYGVPAEVEYDLYLSDTINYVVEVKSHIKPNDVLNFYRKILFAEKILGKKIKPLMISPSITKMAKKKCEELGIDLLVRSMV